MRRKSSIPNPGQEDDFFQSQQNNADGNILTDHGELRKQIDALEARLVEAEEALRAIRNGEVDALVVYSDEGEKIYTLEGADYTYRLLVESIHEGAATLQDDGILIYCNRRFAEMVGVPLESLMGSSIIPYLQPSDRIVFDALVREGLSGSSRGEVILQRNDGSSLPVLFSLGVVQVKDWQGLCLVATDLTEQKRNEKIQAAERWARSILEQAGEAIVVCDKSGKIIRASQAALRFSPQNPLFMPFNEVFKLVINHVGEEPCDFSLETVLNGESFHGLDVRMVYPGAGEEEIQKYFHFLLTATPLFDEEGDILGAIVTLVDITERKQVEEALLISQQRLLLTTEAAGVGIWSLDLAGMELYCDEQTRALLVLPDAIPLKMGFLESLIFPDDFQKVVQVAQQILDINQRGEVEFRIKHPDGTMRWIYGRGQAEFNDEGIARRLFGVVMDITESKQAEEDIRIGLAQIELQRRLLEQREQERLQIARDLHDGPVQELLGTTFLVEAIYQAYQEPELRKSLVQLNKTLLKQVKELRAYTSDLRPPALAHFGLVKAIRSHLTEYQEKYPDMVIQIQADSKEAELPAATRLALFRIYQQALANIAKHAQAKHINIRLSNEVERVIMEIKDNGVGFSAPRDWLELARTGHLGLVGMRERAETIGAKFEVFSTPGKGTRIRVEVPKT